MNKIDLILNRKAGGAAGAVTRYYMNAFKCHREGFLIYF